MLFHHVTSVVQDLPTKKGTPMSLPDKSQTTTASGDKPRTQEQVLKAAINAARIPPACYRVLMALLNRADFGTAVIPEKFQPTETQLAAECGGISARDVKRQIAHAREHGWITVEKRGRKNHYTFAVGTDCTCHAVKPDTRVKTDAERARAYRRRRMLALAESLTEKGTSPRDAIPEGSDGQGTFPRDAEPGKGTSERDAATGEKGTSPRDAATGKGTESRDDRGQDVRDYGDTSRDDFPAQPVFSDERAPRGKDEREEESYTTDIKLAAVLAAPAQAVKGRQYRRDTVENVPVDPWDIEMTPDDRIRDRNAIRMSKGNRVPFCDYCKVNPAEYRDHAWWCPDCGTCVWDGLDLDNPQSGCDCQNCYRLRMLAVAA